MAKAPKSTALTSAVGAMASTATPTDQTESTAANATEQQPAGEGSSQPPVTETASQNTDASQAANTEQGDPVQPQTESTPSSAEQSASGEGGFDLSATGTPSQTTDGVQPPITEQGNTTVSDPAPSEQPPVEEPLTVKPVYKVRVINQSRQALFLQPVKTNLAKGGDQTFEFAHQDAANELASFCRQVNLAQKSDVLRFIHLGA